MNYKYFFIAALFLSISAIGEELSSLPNLGLVKKELLHYHDSGAYTKDLNDTVAQAQAYVEMRAKTIPLAARSHYLLVYDIDETSLSNYSYMESNDFGQPPIYMTAKQAESNAPAIEPVLKLYKIAQSLGFSQVFITGRDEALRVATEENLKKVGYSGWTHLYLRPHASSTPSAADYKAPIRASLIKQGYDIMMNIGDQCSDLATSSRVKGLPEFQLMPACKGQFGVAADRAVKLPDPYYYIA